MKWLKALAAIGCASLLLGATPALAVATLFLTDGTNTVTIFDGGGGDSCGSANCVTWIGTLGIWDINVTTGLSFKPSGGIDLNSVDHSTGAGTLTIYFGDVDFSLGTGTHTLSYLNQIGGTTAGTVRWQSCVDDNNVNPATPPHACTFTSPFFGPLGPGAFSESDGSTTTVNGTFALANAVVITHTGAGNTSFDYELLIVPEPATLLLLGTGLLGLAALRRKQV